MFFFFFQQAETFVEEIFKYLKIEYKRDVKIGDTGIDFILTSKNNLDILIEVKEVKNDLKKVLIMQ